jgi:hypothetical protein
MALPLLEAMSPLSRTVSAGVAAAGAGAPPIRMGFIFIPNGVNVEAWFPREEGGRFELAPTMKSLAPVRDDILVIGGLTHDKGRANGDGPGDHARGASVFLTGYQPVKTSGADIRVGISVDQVAAHAVGKETRFPSLELGCDEGRNSGDCDSGYSCAYSNNISWASPTSPMAKETDPRRVFDRLFSNGEAREAAEVAARRQRRQSILDFVLDDARRLHGRLGRIDQRKVDEYLTSVREIEARVAAAAGPAAGRVGEPEGLPGEAGHRLSFGEHLRLMSDLIVLAFQADVTRIVTFMYARDGSNRSYGEAGVTDGHHDISHHQRNPEKLAKIQKIDSFHTAQFAYLLERLKSVDEGESTILDSSMILFGSGLSDGNRHNHENLPLVLAGRAGGTIDTGRHLRYEHETPVSNLFLSMLDRMGVPADTFGDGTGRLPHLTL